MLGGANIGECGKSLSKFSIKILSIHVIKHWKAVHIFQPFSKHTKSTLGGGGGITCMLKKS